MPTIAAQDPAPTAAEARLTKAPSTLAKTAAETGAEPAPQPVVVPEVVKAPSVEDAQRSIAPEQREQPPVRMQRVGDVAKPVAGSSPAPPRAEAGKPIAEFSVRQISWHPTAARRVAVFEVPGEATPLRLGEGGVVAGFTIEKIGVSSVELVRDGVALKRRVGQN